MSVPIPTLTLRALAQDYAAVLKLRLSFLVVFGAGIGYLVASGGDISLRSFLGMLVGGFLVTAASNTINQIIERDTDALMARTQDRPLVTGRMSPSHGALLAMVCGAAGILLIHFLANGLAASLSFLSLVLYAFIYTPLKRITPISVFVGAIPGAMPVLIGYTAFAGTLTFEAGFLFFLQFIWQFPHFWAIAWLLHDDYTKAGLRMLPAAAPGKQVSLQILVYAASLVPLGLVPAYRQLIPWGFSAVLALAALAFAWKAWQLHATQDRKAAKGVMFGSIIYLPIVQVAYALAKVFQG